jgi:Uma2 family endonuclease
MPATLERRKEKNVCLTPQHNGRRMSLDMFDRAISQPGHTYELGQGVIEVSDIPGFTHALVMQYIRDELTYYKREHPDIIQYLGTGDSSKQLIETFESERHADLAVYVTENPGLEQPWDVWVPEIVVEIVSESSRRRDYEVKPAEYLAFGCREYWLVDPAKNVVLIHARVGGRWQIKSLSTRQKHKTHILPGFVLDVNKVLGARKK